MPGRGHSGHHHTLDDWLLSKQWSGYKFISAANSLHKALDSIETKEAETSDHYGNCSAFDGEHFFDGRLTCSTRLSRNGIDVNQVRRTCSTLVAAADVTPLPGKLAPKV